MLEKESILSAYSVAFSPVYFAVFGGFLSGMTPELHFFLILFLLFISTMK